MYLFIHCFAVLPIVYLSSIATKKLAGLNNDNFMLFGRFYTASNGVFNRLSPMMLNGRVIWTLKFEKIWKLYLPVVPTSSALSSTYGNLCHIHHKKAADPTSKANQSCCQYTIRKSDSFPRLFMKKNLNTTKKLLGIICLIKG